MSSVRLDPASRLLRLLVRGYQHLTSWRVSPCRHVPGCSTYAIKALESHGFIRGGWLAAKRLCRCHPWGTSGFDPVPPMTESNFTRRSSRFTRRSQCST